MDRAHLIPYTVRPSPHPPAACAPHRGEDVAGGRRAYRCVLIGSLLSCLLLIAYVPATYRSARDLAAARPAGSVPGWPRDAPRDLRRYVRPDNATALRWPTLACRSPMQLLVVVCSAPGNVDARNAIRETWASEQALHGLSARVLFLLGETDNATAQEAVDAESSAFGDTVVEDFADTYNNLTLKSAMMLKLFANCAGVRFLMKTDDDMFVSVANLLAMLRAGKSTNLLLGSLICGARPITTQADSKWYAPRYMYPARVYPNYLSGTGYVMSRDVALRLYRAAMATRLFHLEDVFITGICARAAGIRPRDSAAFTFARRPLEPCVYADRGVVTSHRLRPDALRSIWKLLAEPRTCVRPSPPAPAAPGDKKPAARGTRRQNKCF